LSVTPIEVNKVNKTANKPVVAVTAVQLIEIGRELSDLTFLGMDKPKFLNLHLAAEQKNDWRKGSRKWKKE